MSQLQLTMEQEEDIENAFREIDANSNGYIERKELTKMFEELKLKIPPWKVREMIDDIDGQGGEKDGQLTLEEFKQLYIQEFTKQNIGAKFKEHLQTKGNLKTHGGMSKASAEGTTHSVKDEEQVAFTDWINRKLAEDVACKKYLPIKVEELYKACKDGVILCKLINESVPDTIDERVINLEPKNKYSELENHQLTLNSASAIGCTVVNIGGEDIRSGKPHLVLGLMWQIIRIGLLNDINLSANPNLHLLLEEGEDREVLQNLSPEEILIRWVNYQLRNAGSNRTISNFTEDIRDSEAYTYLLHEIASHYENLQDKASLSPLGVADHTQRAEAMLCEADKLGCRSFVSAKDVVKGTHNLNLAFVANLFNNWPALDGKLNQEELVIQETREEKTYRNWMNSLNVTPRVNNLYYDLADGLVYFELYKNIKPGCVDEKYVVRKFGPLASKVTVQKLENCNYVIALGKELNFSLVGIAGVNLRPVPVDSDDRETMEKYTLALLWQLMKAYTLSVLNNIKKEGERDVTDDDIVSWANSKLQSAGKGSVVRSFKDPTLSNGKVIIDVIDAISPGAVNYSIVKEGNSLSEEDKMSNAKYAISLSRKIGARVYALPEDITEVKVKMIMTIFACLMYRDKSK